MAHPKGRHHEKILRMLEENAAPKEIAFALKVPYQTVLTLKNRFFDTVLVRKERTPDPDQGNFFTNHWRQDRL